MRQRLIEIIVGIFIIIAIGAFVFLAFQVSGLTNFGKTEGYQVSANFDNIGGLKLRAPVKMGGVVIGNVDSIHLNTKTFQAKVSLSINHDVQDIPDDSSASIMTAGLLGDNFVSLSPGFDAPPQVLKNGSEIHTTHSALILEQLIGQLLFKIKGK